MKNGGRVSEGNGCRQNIGIRQREVVGLLEHDGLDRPVTGSYTSTCAQVTSISPYPHCVTQERRRRPRQTTTTTTTKKKKKK